MRIRSGYSFRTAYGHLPDVADCIDTTFMPLADRASTFGFVKWQKLCKGKGKQPVYGVELAVSPEPTAKKVTKSHFTFIATNSLAPLHALVRKSTAQFRYEPLLSYEDINALDPSLLVFPGRQALLNRLDTELLGERLMVLHSPSTPIEQLRWATEKNLKRIASSDNYYPSPEDREAYEILCGRGATSQSFAMHILSSTEMEMLAGPEACANAEQVAKLCTAELRAATLLIPDKPSSLREMCVVGALKLGCDLNDPVYSARLDKELGLIEEKQYEDYFYIIADLVEEAKRHMLVGPARGSSCGSLVCYLLGITTVDPIPFGLIFERFIDITRTDLPDIDIDFSDQYRHLAFKYLEDKYGKNRVARLGTVALYKPKSAINETAAALGVPKWKTTAFTASIIERSGGDSRALQSVEDTFKDTQAGQQLIEDHPELAFASKMEGHPRHHSQHAAGVVVTQLPVEEYVAIDSRTNATHCDKKDAEELNLLKIDALGLTQLSVIEDCLKAIGKDHAWLVNYPLDDQQALDVLNQRKWAGIFQWNGNALQSLTQQTTVTEFEDLVAITALARPGPLTSGSATHWIERKNGTEAVEYLHPVFEPHLNSSLGIVIYQEQIMSMGRDIGGLGWDDVTALRKAMSKSLGKEYFDQFGDRFKAGASKFGIPLDKLDKLWSDMCAYGAWCFNRSHAVAYGIISYWCCVLKAHHAVEFAAASLTHEADFDKQLKLLREVVAEGVSYIPVDAKNSIDRWIVVDGRLVGPLSNIKGLGPKMLQEILHCRKNNMPLSKKAQKLLDNPVTPIDELNPVGKKIAVLYPDGLSTAGVISETTELIDAQCTGRKEDLVVVAKVIDINPRDHNEVGNLAKRGGRIINGPHLFLNLVIEDDTDRLLARVNRFDYERVAKPIIDRGDAGAALYALKGRLLPDFRLIEVSRVIYLGSMKQ
jgi:DNA polymerase III alpha subunit